MCDRTGIFTTTAYSTEDLIVVPNTNPWFQFYADGQDKVVTPWNQTQSYQEDWIGLRTLQESGRLLHWSIPCGHQDIPRDDCRQYSYDGVVRPLLNNTLAS